MTARSASRLAAFLAARRRALCRAFSASVAIVGPAFLQLSDSDGCGNAPGTLEEWAEAPAPRGRRSFSQFDLAGRRSAAGAVAVGLIREETTRWDAATVC